MFTKKTNFKKNFNFTKRLLKSEGIGVFDRHFIFLDKSLKTIFWFCHKGCPETVFEILNRASEVVCDAEVEFLIRMPFWRTEIPSIFLKTEI